MTKCHLSWDSYQKNISSGLSNFQQHGEFVDMTIATGGHLVQVHKNLLALASPYIKSMIQTVPCQHPVIFLSDINDEILGLILEYVYTGEVLMPTHKMEPFLKACQDLHIIGVQGIVPPKLAPEPASNASNLMQDNKSSNKTSQMTQQTDSIGNIINLSTKPKVIKKTNTNNKINILKNTAVLKISGTGDNRIIDDTNTERFAQAEDQHQYQTVEAANPEVESSVYSSQIFLTQSDIAKNVDKALSYRENVGFSTYGNNDKRASVQSQSFTKESAQNNDKITGKPGKTNLMSSCTEDLQRVIGVHVIDSLNSISNSIQEMQLPDAMATTLPRPLNESNSSNCFMMNYDDTNIQNNAGDNTDTLTEEYTCARDEDDDCMDIEEDVKAEIELSYDKNNQLVIITPKIEQCKPVQKYTELDIENSTDKIENALHNDVNTKARYNINVELPGGSKGPPRITIVSGAIQNKPLDTVDSNTVPEVESTGKSGNSPTVKASFDVSGSTPLYMVNGKSKLQMILNRFIYSVHHTAKRSQRWRWRCIDYRHKRCSAYIDSIGDLIVDRKHVHSHPFHDKKVVNLGRRRCVFSSLKEIQERVGGVSLDNLHNIDLGFLNDEF